MRHRLSLSLSLSLSFSLSFSLSSPPPLSSPLIASPLLLYVPTHLSVCLKQACKSRADLDAGTGEGCCGGGDSRILTAEAPLPLKPPGVPPPRLAVYTSGSILSVPNSTLDSVRFMRRGKTMPPVCLAGLTPHRREATQNLEGAQVGRVCRPCRTHLRTGPATSADYEEWKRLDRGPPGRKGTLNTCTGQNPWRVLVCHGAGRPRSGRQLPRIRKRTEVWLRPERPTGGAGTRQSEAAEGLKIHRNQIVRMHKSV